MDISRASDLQTTTSTTAVSDDSNNLHTNGTDIIVRDEVRVETVIIILWAFGGVLLLILLILLVCILRNSKKSGLDCSRGESVFRIRPRGQSAGNGSLNHGYTSYDEIWTWIPIIRGRQDECPRQDPSAPVFTTSTSNSLHRQLEPPPYSVAIASPPSTHISSSSHTHNTRVPSSVNSPNQGNPVSTIDLPSVSGSAPAQRSSSETCASSGDAAVNMPSDSALSRNTHAQEIGAEAPRIHVEQEILSSNQIQGQQSHDIRDGCRLSVQSPSLQRSHTVHVPYNNPAGARQNITGSRSVRNHSPYLNERRSVRDFIYDPDEGMYSFVSGGNGRRIWCDIPPTLLDEDGPPPYSASPNVHTRRFSERNVHSAGRTSRYHANSNNYASPATNSNGNDSRVPVPNGRRESGSSPLSRNETRHNLHFDTQAPVARLEYDYF